MQSWHKACGSPTFTQNIRDITLSKICKENKKNIVEFVEVEYRPTASTEITVPSHPNLSKDIELYSLKRPVISGPLPHAAAAPTLKTTKLQKIREEDNGDAEVTETSFV
jgi:hypothetical protein